MRRWVFVILGVVTVAVATFLYGFYRDAHPYAEVSALLELLNAKPGTVVADIGAGEGYTTTAAAQILGPSATVYATELGEDQVEALRKTGERQGLPNIVPLRGAEDQANLPEACCDVIFMSKVYHHFTRTAEMNASLYKALKPGGRLTVIDFEPRWWRFWLRLPDGVPRNRGGHGMPRAILVAEMKEAGFTLDRSIAEWWRFPEERYCLIFRKSELNNNSSRDGERR